MAGSLGVIASDLAKLVRGSAPLIASALGSPLAGTALALLSGAFGSPPDQLAAALNADPTAAEKLKALELTHAETLRQIDSHDYSTEVADRMDARVRGTLYPDFMRHLAYLVTAGFFGALVVLLLPIQFDPHERELLSMLIGMLVSKWQTIIDYFYGSSRTQ